MKKTNSKTTAFEDHFLLKWCLEQLSSCISDTDWRHTGKELKKRLETYLKSSDVELPDGY